MPIYTLCSTDPEHYEQILVTIPFSNATNMCEIQILSLCTLFNVELLSGEDYILLESQGRLYKIFAHNTCRLTLDSLRDYVFSWVQEGGAEGFEIEINSTNQLEISHSYPFKIHAMTYNFKNALGFYYVGGEYGAADGFPLESKAPDIPGGSYVITSKAVPFTASSPILYLLSNLGGSCYRMNATQNSVQGGSLGMIIPNSFTSGMPMIAMQADITSHCFASDLSQIRITLVDFNMKPLKLLNPMFCVVSVQEIPEGDNEA
jgi:hypothetical protein